MKTHWHKALRLSVSMAFLLAISNSGSVAFAAGAGATTSAGTAPRVLLIAQKQTTLVAQTTGQIRSIRSGLGSLFAKGRTLVRFECGQQLAHGVIAEADLEAARQNLNAKQRLKKLKAAGEVEVAMAKAAMQKSAGELQLAKVRMGLCRVRAPYAGRIVKRHVSQYQGAKIGDPLLDIVGAGPLKLQLNVPSKWLTWLKLGSSLTVLIDETGQNYDAKVIALNARVDAVSQSIEIEASLTGKHPELLAGMSGTAHFKGAQK